jgi:hypothetical protein
MKKILLVLAAMLFICAVFTVPPAFAEAEQELSVIVNKKRVDFSGDVKPFINLDNRTMVPVRFVSNELGASVDWDPDLKKVTISQAGKMIVLIIGDSFARVNGQRVEFDTAAVIMDGRTMVPLRFVSQSFGADVGWEALTRTVFITTGPDEPLPPPAVTTVKLYFSDNQARYLVPEMREVTITGQRLVEIVFNELIQGPRRADLRPTIPGGTEVSLVMFQDVAQLFLSSHFRDNHPGGSAAELMTLYSIVNSLTDLPEVNKVLFLLADNRGNLIPTEAILGHVNTEQPLSPRPELVKE